MNLRNWLFDTIIPADLLRKIVVKRIAGRGIALMYHEVLPDDQGPAAWTVVKESDFKEQMIFLKRYFDVLTINEALERIKHAENAEKPFAVVTFDDGYRGNVSCVLPILEELRIPAHFFIATRATETGEIYWYDTVISLYHYHGKLEVSLQDYGLGAFHLNQSDNAKNDWAAMQRLLTSLKKLAPAIREKIVADIMRRLGKTPNALQMMNIPELQKLADSPFATIGGHSHCHNILLQLSDRALDDSLAVNRKKLMGWTEQKIDHFSYPNGDYDERVVQVVRKVGYKSAVTTQGKQWGVNVNAYELPRYGVGRFDSPGLFIARLGQLA